MRFFLLAIGEKNPDFFSKEIQDGLSKMYGVKVDWSHIALLVESGDPMFAGVWDLTSRGWDHCGLNEALDNGGAVIRKKIQLNVIDSARACGWLLGYRKTPYSRLQFFLSLPKWILAIFDFILPKFVKRWFKNGKARGYCSEGLARFMFDNCPTASGDPRLSDDACDTCDPFKVVGISLDYGTEAGHE